MGKKVIVIGAGVAGMAAAIRLADRGCAVRVIERHGTVGGRARVLRTHGYTFDRGPSWYWMPDVFERFFQSLGTSASDFYQLVRLDPAFRMFLPEGERLDIPGCAEGLTELFEQLEPGAGDRLQHFMAEARLKYEIGVQRLAFKPCRSVAEFFDPELLRNLHRLHLFTRFDRYVARFFSDSRLKRLMEFPILFLGTLPQTTPAMYSFMNYGGLCGGTWYPRNGMSELPRALETLARARGVEFHFGQSVQRIELQGDRARAVTLESDSLPADSVVASADYHHVEQELLPREGRTYSARYWEQRRMAPSSLIFYLGISKRLPSLLHHNLFFDGDTEQHTRDLYAAPAWPRSPLFYACCPSKTDPTVAPPGKENLFLLIPIAAGLEDDANERSRLFDVVLRRLEAVTGTRLRDAIEVQETYCLDDFRRDYSAFKGNAYGLANTLAQTAFGKPAIVSRNVKNLVFAGQLTTPGPGLPPALISGQIAAEVLTA